MEVGRMFSVFCVFIIFCGIIYSCDLKRKERKEERQAIFAELLLLKLYFQYNEQKKEGYPNNVT